MFNKKKSLNFDAYGFPKAHKKEFKETIGYAIGQSKIGQILVATFELGILAVLNGKTKTVLTKELVSLFPKDDLIKDDPEAKKALAEVIMLVDSPEYDFIYPVFIQGTPFQKKVYQAVQEVPFGQTASYSQIAEKIGAPRAMRAVGSTCTRNKLFLVVPCHRIVRKDYKAQPVKPRGKRDMLFAREISFVKK